MPENTEQKWDDYLTELELDYSYASARRVAPDEHTWRAPEDLGPVPEKFADRARRLIGLQTTLISELAAEQEEVGKHLAALRQVPKKQKTPVYLDQTA
ncbi:hypothetical protein [Leifsonia sp. Leaf264]|uniref:hypothetical protein n=1 Tax=Leifsonia sp. Leaf264 TaxID=1736314 RepID=UPI0006F62092|nr:hypothetical protein [Leifsonia sp. Leaf264]KQO98228.1 hypothetical protein ASF30_09205 [Leifsonia sp. Leaf264]